MILYVYMMRKLNSLLICSVLKPSGDFATHLKML